MNKLDEERNNLSEEQELNKLESKIRRGYYLGGLSASASIVGGMEMIISAEMGIESPMTPYCAALFGLSTMAFPFIFYTHMPADSKEKRLAEKLFYSGRI